jgi:hypothetical protein
MFLISIFLNVWTCVQTCIHGTEQICTVSTVKTHQSFMCTRNTGQGTRSSCRMMYVYSWIAYMMCTYVVCVWNDVIVGIAEQGTRARLVLYRPQPRVERRCVSNVRASERNGDRHVWHAGVMYAYVCNHVLTWTLTMRQSMYVIQWCVMHARMCVYDVYVGCVLLGWFVTMLTWHEGWRDDAAVTVHMHAACVSG